MSKFKPALVLGAVIFSAPLVLADSEKKAQPLDLSEPIVLQEEAQISPPVDIAEPSSLKDVVTNPEFEHAQHLQYEDHIDEDTEQNVHDVVNAKPILKPQKPDANGFVQPDYRGDTYSEKQLPVQDPDLLQKFKQMVAQKDFTIELPTVPEALVLLDTAIPPGTATRLAWSPDQSFQGIATPTPVLVVNGINPGPIVCLTAAIHGDELNGIEIVRRVLYKLDPEKLSGAVIGVPIVNLQGFHRHSRYLTDRRDLNRYFPGDPKGSSASRIAYSFFNEVISYCDALVDLHTGSFYRTNMPQLRADTNNPDVLAFAKQFGATIIVHSDGAFGTLRKAAVDAGIPAITLEAGESMRLQESAVEHGVKGIETLLEQKEMLGSLKFWKTTEAIYKQSLWVRADQGGILFSKVKQGAKVKKGEVLGVVTDPITNLSSEIVAPFKGRVLGLALNQVVMPGFATFHLGVEAANILQTEVAEELNQRNSVEQQTEENGEDFN